MGNCVSSGAARTLNQQKKQVPDSIVSLFESYAGKKSALSVQDLQQVLVDQVSPGDPPSRLLASSMTPSCNTKTSIIPCTP